MLGMTVRANGFREGGKKMFNFDLSGKNKYYTLYQNIRTEILSGRVRAGERLPSKRVLAEELGVSVVTVQLAYEQLLAEGYVTAKERSGYFVEQISPAAPSCNKSFMRNLHGQAVQTQCPQKFKIDFVKGSPPAELFPFATWAKLMRAVLADCGEHLLERVPCSGDGELQRAVAAYLYRARGLSVEPERVIIGAGAEFLYGVIVQLLGRENTFAVENPGYRKISSAYALYGAKILPVPVNDAGICLDEIEKSTASAVHVSPAHQFPTGAVMPVSSRLRLIKWAESTGGYIIEDDYDSEFRLVGKPLQCTCAVAPEKVIYVNTFSKSLAPSMRLGYMVLPPALYEKYLQIFSESANAVPLFEQKALAKMLDGGYFERYVARLKNYYKGIRREILGTAGRLPSQCEIFDTGSGPHMVIKFPRAQNDGQIKRQAAQMGVNIKCLSDYSVAPLSGVEKCAVINYSGVTGEQLAALSF